MSSKLVGLNGQPAHPPAPARAVIQWALTIPTGWIGGDPMNPGKILNTLSLTGLIVDGEIGIGRVICTDTLNMAGGAVLNIIYKRWIVDQVFDLFRVLEPKFRDFILGHDTTRPRLFYWNFDHLRHNSRAKVPGLPLEKGEILELLRAIDPICKLAGVILPDANEFERATDNRT